MDDPKTIAARSWFGYGRWDTPYWLIGMEPGGTDDHASYEVWMQLGGTELIDCREHHLRSNCSKWYEGLLPPPQPTWRRLIQLLLGYEGKPADSNAVSMYQRGKWGALKGESALVEVSALHSKNLATSVDRGAYREQRIAVLQTRLNTYHPKFAVFYGAVYRDIYEKIANKHFDVNGYAWYGSTLCSLVVGPTGRNIPVEMKSPDWWIEKGREMRVAVEIRLLPEAITGSMPRLPNPHARQIPQPRPQSRVDHETDPLPSDVIRLLRDENPKRVGSKSRLRFDCYRDGMTVAQYTDAVRKRLGDGEAQNCGLDLKFDTDPKRHFIQIERHGMPITIRRTASMSYGRTRDS